MSAVSSREFRPSIHVTLDSDDKICKGVQQRGEFDQKVSEISQKVFDQLELIRLMDDTSKALSQVKTNSDYKTILRAYCLAKTAELKSNDLVFIKWNKKFPAGGERPVESFDSFKTKFFSHLTLQVGELASKLDGIESWIRK